MTCCSGAALQSVLPTRELPPAAGSGSRKLGPEHVDERNVRGSRTQAQARADSPCAWPCLPRLSACPPPPPRPQLPNSPPPFSSLAFPPQHLSFAANALALRAILLSGFSVADFHVLFPSLSGECFFILFYLFLIVVK